MDTSIDLKDVLNSDKFISNKNGVFLPIGVDSAGKALFHDLASNGGILIAGETGSGKSMFIHCAISSLISRYPPEEIKFIFIDPKRVELSIYDKLGEDGDGLPHMITPVIQDVKKVYGAIRWAQSEMRRRFDKLNQDAINIVEYNNKHSEKMPHIAILVDEFSDLMATDSKFYTEALGQMAAVGPTVGIYLIIATSRPSNDVYPTKLKNNFRTKIAFKTASKKDSQVIIGKQRAVSISAPGQMYYKNFDRIKGLRGFYTDTKDMAMKNGILELMAAENLRREQRLATLGEEAQGDDLYGEAKTVVVSVGKASASLIQRRLKIGYARAARLLDILEENGIIGPGEGAKPRNVYLSADSLSDEDKKSLASQAVFTKSSEEDDELYGYAKTLVIKHGVASASFLQSKLGVGYARAARLLDILEELGIIGSGNGDETRDVFIKPDGTENA